jgi:acetyl esterase/lipase
MVAVSPNNPRFQPGFEQADTRVQGAVIFYGVPDLVSAFGERRNVGMARFLELVVFRARYRDNPDLFLACQPASYISADVPPILLVHGMSDSVVPCKESRRFAQQLREAGARQVHLLEMPRALHAFEVFPSPMHQRAMRIVLRFMDSLRRERSALPAGNEARAALPKPARELQSAR